VFGPNTAGAIIGDGTGGGVLYNLKSASTYEAGTRHAEPPKAVRETREMFVDPGMLASLLAILGGFFIVLSLARRASRQAVLTSSRRA